MELLLTTVAIFGMGYALARAYRLGDYAVETWQDQFDSGNNYFTIQAYCVDYYFLQVAMKDHLHKKLFNFC